MRADSFVIMVGDDAGSLAAFCRRIEQRFADVGWSPAVSRPFVQVFAPSTVRLQITEGLDGQGVLVGEMFDRAGRVLSIEERGVVGCRKLDFKAAKAIVSDRWGRYVLVRRATGAVSILRDPSGAIEVVAWRKDGVTLIAPNAPMVLDCLLPDELEIDWKEVGIQIQRKGRHRHSLALKGLEPVAAGELLTLGSGKTDRTQIWTPAEIYRAARGRDRPDLRSVVDMAVRALAGDRRWVAEVSGGLDSAIVVGALEPRQREAVTAWVNHFAEQPESDERAFARLVVEQFGSPLTEVRRDGLTLCAERLAQSADGFRPAINDLDPDYNSDIADRIAGSGAWGSLTGQGGDAVFFQMASFLIAFDEILERGPRFRPAVVHRIARWTGRSVWPASWFKAWRDYGRSRASWDHPWMADLEGVPPAKALQISTLATCQTFQGLAVRNRDGPCLNPLLSQPVMEAGLAWSTVDLTWGGRDRSAARAAYADVLPPTLFARRSKGEMGIFYADAVAQRLDFLRPFILEGELAKAGLVEPGLAQDMTREALLWRGGFSRLLSLALTEAWLRSWIPRLAHRRA